MTETITWVDLDSREQADEDNGDTPEFDQTTLAVDQFEERLLGLPLSYSVLILLIFPSNRFVARIAAIKKEIKKNQILGVQSYTVNDPSLPISSVNLCFASKSAIIHKIKSNIVKYLDEERLANYTTRLTAVSSLVNDGSERLAKQLLQYNRIRGTQVLLIPWNVSQDDFLKTRVRLESICQNLAANGQQYVIRTLDDYISKGEEYFNERSHKAYLLKHYKGEICRTIMRLSFIRIYVVGKELYVSNDWSKKLAALELDINQEHNIKYVDRCSFIAAPGIDAASIGDLCPRFRQTVQSASIIPKDFDIFQDDAQLAIFSQALEYAHDRLPYREMKVNHDLQQQSPVNSQVNSRSNSPVLLDQQAESGPEAREPADDIRRTVGDPDQ